MAQEAGDVAEARPAPFKLERFFEKYEFKAPHLLCCSDCEPLTLRELLELADDDATHRWNSLKLSYTEPAGLTPLREAIAGLYDGAVTAEQLLVCAPEEGVYLTMKALLRPGDRVVCAYPAYQSLYELALATDCHLDFWEPKWDEAAGKLRFDVSDLEALIFGVTARGGAASPAASPVRLVVVNFPHNPTGETVTREEQQRIVEACRGAGAYLFSDEMYWRSEPKETLRLPPAVGLYERAVSLCGVSKSWALPGLRVGWVACRDSALLGRAAALKDYTTICTAGPSEVLALIAVRATEELTRRSRDIIEANTGLGSAFFDRWSNLFDWQPPGAGPIAFPRLRLEAARKLDRGGGPPIKGIDDFCKQLVDEAGVLLLPATVYDHPPSVERCHFRVGLGRKSAPEVLRHWNAWMERRFGADEGAAAPS